MGKQFSIDRWTGRSANAFTLWPLVPSGAVALVTYFFAKGSSWVSQFGPFGWWVAALLSFVISAGGLYLVGKAREQWALARAAKKWGRDVDAINPLEPEFAKKRINIHEVAHPVLKRIVRKRFTGCQLMGPANVVFIGETTISHCTFGACEYVIVREGVRLMNAVAFEDCLLFESEIVGCTIFTSQALFDASFRPNGQVALTYDAPQGGQNGR